MRGTPQHAPEFANHGSVFQTTAFKRIVDEADLTADQVHDFTFELCHVYQRATKVVSCPVHSLLLGCLSPPTSAVAEAARSVTL